jgi:[citrate (pro-3S)-lyase] ligase
MLMETLDARAVNLQDDRQAGIFRAFLAEAGLGFTGNLEAAYCFYDGERLVGTGAIYGKVLRNIAVVEDVRGEGITAAIVTRLIQEQRRRGRYHYFIYTQPGKAGIFKSLGFQEIARAEPYAALLELGLGSVREYCARLMKDVAGLPTGKRAGLVVNCNPFTLGHQALITQAAAANDSVIVFVVSEDRSVFPAAHRLRLVKEGTQHLKNVAVVSGEDYIISSATFPAYFTREEETVLAQTRLDATLFAAQLAPRLGITARWVGEEPYCPVTRAYNQALLEILPSHNITVEVAPRFAADEGIVSASKVRDAIRRSDWTAVRRMVPDTTWNYLMTDEAQEVVGCIRQSCGRH